MSGSWHDGRWSSWFSLAREDGGPTYYPHQYLTCPDFVWNAYTVVCIVVFIFPILIFFFLLPSFRGKHRSSSMVVLLCFLTGFILTVVMGSSSWLVGEAEVRVSLGPMRPPVTGKVGVWAGLWHVNLTYTTANLSLNEMVRWSSRLDVVRAHQAALRGGWPYALLAVTAELGGEGSGWRGCLGDGIRQAGLAASYLLVASMYVWAVWVVLFTVAPELTARPLMVTGLLMASCTLLYVLFIGAHVPQEFILCGSHMHLHLGHAWWLTTAMGVALTAAGAGLLLYNARHPGHLSTFFEIDFGLTSHRSFHPTWNREPLFAYKHAETYSQYSPYTLCTTVNSTRNSVDEDPGKGGRSDKKDTTEGNSETVCDWMENITEHHDQNPAHPSPKIDYFLESETSPQTDTSERQVLPHSTTTTVTLSGGSLAHDQEHTVLLEPELTILRRRSPEQTESQDKQQSSSLTRTQEPETPLSTSATHACSVPPPRQGPTTPLRSSLFIQSCRKSLRWSLSKAHSKLYLPRIPVGLTLNSNKSQSLTNLVCEEDGHRKMERVPREVPESRTKF